MTHPQTTHLTHPQKILLIEDEEVIRSFLTAILNAEDYAVLTASTGQEGISMAATHSPDLVLLDLGLPDLEGMEVLARIRSWSDLPVIVVSARQSEQEKVQALDAGANDYVTKPFGNRELLARVRSSLRLYNSQKGVRDSVFSAGGLCIDYARRLVTVRGTPVHLTPIEYKILTTLSQSAGKVLTHDHIITEVWGPYSGDSQILRVNMANIRHKIEENAADPVYITTEIGVGYRLLEEGDGS